jgi:hypothetical protein
VYRQVALLRQDKAAFHTHHVMFLPGSDNVLAYVRYNPDDSVSSAPYLIAINLGPDTTTGLGTDEVLISGIIYKYGLLELDSKIGSVSNTAKAQVLMRLTDVRLERGQAVILQLTVTRNDEL